MRKTTRFKNLLHDPKILTIPVPLDVLSAKIMESVGFETICVGGYGVSATLLGKPDIALLTMTEMVEHVARTVEAVDIPVFVDADTGHGGILNAIRTTRKLEAAGAAGLFLEDQVFPKRCGHMAGKEVVPAEEMLSKLKAVLDARIDPDFVVMARTDALAVHGIEEALRRARLYQEAGADMIFVEALRTVEEMTMVNEAIEVPTLANIIEGGLTPELSADELEKLGFAAVTFPCTAAYTAAKAVREVMTELYRTGSTAGLSGHMLSFHEFNEVVGLSGLRKKELDYHQAFRSK